MKLIRKNAMRTLSKTNLLAFRQCPKRLWLEIHHRDLRNDSAKTEARFQIGDGVGEVARMIYDSKGRGVVFDRYAEGFDAVIDRTAELICQRQPLFEAGFVADGVRFYADVMLPISRISRKVWRMVEVKSSTSVEATHRDDAAIQAYIARASGVPLHSISLAHIDSQWVYPGDTDYRGLLKEEDLTEEAFGREEEIKDWIAAAQTVARKRKEPEVDVGSQCIAPYPCGFIDHCQRDSVVPEYPVAWLPNLRRNSQLSALIETEGIRDLNDVPDHSLNPMQLRVKAHTLAGTIYFDLIAATASLASHKLPAFFLDFETIEFAVPIWKGTRPYQPVPFQFSLHRLSRTGKLSHQEFLDLSGLDPARKIAEALIAACGERGPIFVYSSYESNCICDLAERFPRLSRALLAIDERLVDLLPIAREHYYHPDQHGRWGIKHILPTIAPDLRYDELDGVQDGLMAMDAYREAVHRDTPSQRKQEIERQLLDYCGLDSIAMVRLWQHFTGRGDMGV